MFPLTLKFLHVFEIHVFTSCNELNTHMHKKNIDCSICDFQFSIFSFKLDNFQYLSVSKSRFSPSVEYVSIDKNIFYHRFYLRGPPQF